MKAPKKRNPMALELAKNPLFKTRVHKSDQERAARSDKWDRSAKHKKKPPDQDAA